MVRRFCLILGLAGLLAAPGAALAKPALVFDSTNSRVLYSEDQDMLWHPASLTKLMTAYLVFEALKSKKTTLKSKVKCSAHANRQPPSKVGLRVGGEISVDLALRALIVKSANDVAVMLAEHVSGSEKKFAVLMNKTAKRLGMSRSHFVNPNGLPDARQVTSARDMGLLARALINDFPEYGHYFALDAVKFGKRNLRSHNGLLRTFSGADGMKTGFICASGYNVVASATRNGKHLVAVVLGGKTSAARNLRARELLEHGFQNYFWKGLFDNENLDTLPPDSSITMGPINLRNTVCGHRRKSSKKQKVLTQKK